MSDIQDYIRVLQKWNSQPMKTVSNVLLRLQKLTVNEEQQDLERVIKAIGTFKKQANNHQKQQQIQQTWFTQLNKAKNHITDLIQQHKRNRGPKFITKQSKIQLPDELVEDKSQIYKQIMKSFYKHFVMNMSTDILKENNKILDFLDRIIKCIFQQFGFSDEKANNSQEKTNKMFQRVQTIYKKLGRSSSTLAKLEMMVDKKDPELVAKMDQKAFDSEQGDRRKKLHMQRILKQNSTGFYEDLKKRINADAKQQCRYCHKQTAYCEGQKQIRASDEPMTKFMRCNSCDRQWRQQ